MTHQYYEGQALVASPYLADPNFLRSVVYLVKHDEDGAYGLILNRPMEITVGQLLREVLEEAVDIDEPIYHGGPVEGPIVVVHEEEVDGASPVEPGVYLSSDQDDLAAICSKSGGRYRVFNGYAGWAPEQLDDELKLGGWLTWKITKEDLFAAPDEIWQTAIRQIGRDILTEGIAAGRIPDDPSTN